MKVGNTIYLLVYIKICVVFLLYLVNDSRMQRELARAPKCALIMLMDFSNEIPWLLRKDTSGTLGLLWSS